MTDETLMITLKDRDPVFVKKERLVESSPVFSHNILECSQSVHDMTDFPPGIAELFLKLLEDRRLEEIEAKDFRELHKISVFYNVQWLTESCREWLLKKISNLEIDGGVGHDDAGKNSAEEILRSETLSFLFKECYFIHKQWNLTQFMEALILRARFKNTSLFQSRFIQENYDQISTDELKFLLHLAGSNSKVFLKLIIDRISSQECMDDHIRYLLQSMNLSLCVEQEEKMYHQMSRMLAEMNNLSNEDCRILLKLTTGAAGEASDRKNRSEETRVTTVYDDGGWSALLNDVDCSSLSDIPRLIIAENRISTMYTVIDCLVKVVVNDNFCTKTMSIDEFVASLENFTQKKILQKVSTQHVDMCIASLIKFSNHDNKHIFIDLLTKIRKSEKLSSSYDTMRLLGKKIAQATTVSSLRDLVACSLKSFLGQENPDSLYAFKMDHPGVTGCSEKKSDCGFVITDEKYPKCEISGAARDQTMGGVHMHEEIRAENMNWYWIVRVPTRSEGDFIRVPLRWWWWWWWGWSKWFDPSLEFKFENFDQTTEYCVDYNIRENLVAK